MLDNHGLRSDSLITMPNGQRRQIDEHELRDDQVADRLVTMPRQSIYYLTWLSTGRERILYLSQLVAEARAMLAQVGSGWPPSRPMSSAPRDGTWLLIQGQHGQFVAKWQSEGEHSGYWRMRGLSLAINNPHRWWPLPEGAV